MNVQSINPVVSVSSFTGGGDTIALLQAIFAASAHEMRGAAAALSTQALQYLADLGELRELEDQLAALAPAGDGKSLLLGSTLDGGKALKAQVEALGFSLATEERYNLSSVTKDKTGKVLSTSAKHLGTTAEMTAAEAGKLVSGPTADGVEVRTVTAADGSTTTYTLSKNERALTATQAAVTTLIGEMQTRMDALQQVVTSEVSRAQAFANVMMDRSREGEALFTTPREKERKQEDTRLLDNSKATDDEIRTRLRVRREIEQHHKTQERNRAD